MKRTMRRLASLTALVAVTCFASANAGTVNGDDLLTIGSDAPALDVEHWVQNGGGKFGKVTKFEKGKVYVVEFWATWCGPCIGSMPHIVEIQKKFADKGVQIVSISDEDLDTVKEFLVRELPPSLQSDEVTAKNFAELTKSYCLTTDPDGSSSKDYMEAAKQNGIPCAFIVGKDAKIEWIGHPTQMDEPLEQVVEGKWDREKFGREFKEVQEQEALMQEVQIAVGGLLRKKQFPEALAKLDEFIAKVSRNEMKLNLLMTKVNLHQIAGSDAKEVNGTFAEVFKIAGDEPMIANQVSWTVWEMFDAGRVESKEVLKGALDLAKKASDKQTGNMKAMTLDTVSHLEYALGNKEAALKIQEEAFALADEDGKENLKPFLEELKEELGKSK